MAVPRQAMTRGQERGAGLTDQSHSRIAGHANVTHDDVQPGIYLLSQVAYALHATYVQLVLARIYVCKRKRTRSLDANAN